MCVGFYTLGHPDYALVLCTNRDEYLARPTLAAAFHNFGDIPKEISADRHETDVGDNLGGLYVLSGRDVKAGGTWLGINRSGNIALLTNITGNGEQGAFTTSRGDLTSSFLMASSSPGTEGHEPNGQEPVGPGMPPKTNGGDAAIETATTSSLQTFVDNLVSPPNQKPYAGFNLLLLSTTRDAVNRDWRYEGQYVSNSGGGGLVTARPLREDERQCGGITTGAEIHDGANWEKLVEGRAELQKLLDRHPLGVKREDELIDGLFKLLSLSCPRTISSRAQLRYNIRINHFNVVPSEIPQSLRQEYSASKSLGTEPAVEYGTRLSTVILVRKDGDVTFIERDIWKYAEDGKIVLGSPNDDRRFRFKL